MASFGEEIPDQFTNITESLSTHITLTHDVSTFLAERAALEREYAAKLSALTKKVKEKREKRCMECVVGPEPAKVYSVDVGQRSTLQRYLAKAITMTESVSTDHINLANGLEQLSNEVDTGAKKGEEMRKKHNAFYQKLIADREKTYSERAKAKSKYDETCHELESMRAKLEKGDSDRAKKAVQAAEEEMWNAKNIYLVSIAASNRAQSRFFTEDLPRVQDDLQSLLTLTDHNLRSHIQRTTSHAAQHAERLAQKNREVEADAQSVNTSTDQDVFSEFNKRRFDMPKDFTFEPCQGFFDTEEMSTGSTSAHTFLQNMLLRKQKQLSESIPIIESKAKEIQGLTKLRDAYLSQKGLGDPAEVTDNLLESIRSAIVLEVSASLLDAEIQAISASIGSDHLNSARPHLFESKAFTIPATCQFCDGKIFGLNRQGCVCRSCSYTCHQKCEPKVPATCRAAPASGAASSAATASAASMLSRTASVRTATSASSGGGAGGSSSTRPASGIPASSSSRSIDSQQQGSARASAPPARRTLPPMSGSAAPSGATPRPSAAASAAATAPRVKALYAYDATASNELSMADGQVLTLVEADEDGSGWITVRDPTSGRQGLVPESYTMRMLSGGGGGGGGEDEDDDEDDDADSDDDDDEDDDSSGSGTKRVKALYAYTATAPDELSLAEGEMIMLTSTGFDVGNGWCQGVNTQGNKGVFPANYVERL